MNPKQAYLAWLRQEAPAVYAAALQKIMRRPRSLGGLNTDLVGSVYSPLTGFGSLADTMLSPVTISAPSLPALPTIDTSTLTSPDLSASYLSSTSIPSINVSSGGSGSSWWNSNTFSSLINAVGNVASTALTVNAQNNLLNLNTQRAQQGLWPVQANGAPVPASQLYPSSSPALAQFESGITSSGMTMPLLLVAGAGVLLFALSRRRQ